MAVSGVGGVGSYGFLRIRSPESDSGSTVSLARQRRIGDLKDLHLRTHEARQGFVALFDRLTNAIRSGVTRSSAIASSTADLDLQLEDTKTSLESSEEVNAIQTSYSPFGPSWHGGSTSTVTVTGAYEGTEDDTLTFWAKGTGFVGGLAPIDIEVRDGQGAVLETVRLTSSSMDTPIALSNGLELTFGSGVILRDNWFAVEVSASEASSVDPDKTFNGTRDDRPNFEPGVSVTAGSFRVNGKTIIVASSDTLNKVVEKINQSSAGVIAEFDETAEAIRFTQTTGGPDATIVLSNDSSGFLAATKLDDATQELGEWNEWDHPMGDLGRFASVTSGALILNGVSIALDPALDSLEQLLDRITDSEAGVIASYDSSSGRVKLTSRDASEPLSVESDATGVLDVLGVELQTAEPVEGRSATLRQLPDQELDRAAQLLRAVLSATHSNASTEVSALQTGVRRAISRTLSSLLSRDVPSSGRVRAFGFDFKFESDGGVALSVDEEQLGRALRRDPEQVLDFLLKDESGESRDGLLTRLLGELTTNERDLADELGGLGVFVDVLA